MFYNLALLLPSMVCLFWGMLLFCERKSNSRSQNVLIFYVMLASISFFTVANYLAGITDYALYYKLDIVDGFVTLSVFPMMYLYFKSLTHETPFSWKDYIWFLPALIIGGCTFFLYAIMGSENAAGYIWTLLTHRPLAPAYTGILYKFHLLITIYAYNIVLMLQSTVVCIYATVSVFRYHRRLRDFYSALDDKSMHRNYGVLACFMLSMFFALVFIFLGGRSFWIQYHLPTALFFIAWSAASFGLCFHGSRMKYTIEDFARDLELADREAAENNYASYNEENKIDSNDNQFLQTGKYSKYLILLEQLIEQDKIFLRYDLRVDELARMLHTNRTYISRMIREEYQCTFSDYINGKRIEFAKDLMRANPDMRQIEVAEKSGFINAPSFNRTFKHMTGIPPKEWLVNEIADC